MIARVAALLREKMGLDAASIGTAAIERAVRERLSACGSQDSHAYWEHLCASEVELQALIEGVVVPETWFFRDREAFTALTRIAHCVLSSSAADRVLRILSLPCATGEEPFSVAMALLDSGMPAHRFHIDAVDISSRAIATAERGVYGKNSFRGAPVDFRERHFTLADKDYELHEAIRRQVRFRQANLFAAGSFPTPHIYDAVFCRNVLIYFAVPGRKQAVRLLGRLLGPGGTLFVGPAESALLLDHGYISAHIPLAFAFHKAVPVAATVGGGAKVMRPLPAERLSTPFPATAHTTLRPAGAASKPVDRLPRGPSAAQLPEVSAQGWLAQAQRLADQGKVAEAMQYCQQNLREAPSAEAFYLVGLLHDAVDESEQARAHYRKALYLEPTHREALVHLAEALIRDGDTNEAQRLFDRAKRLQAADGLRHE
jgi:chemotaxis protein methyltransferase WspC